MGINTIVSSENALLAERSFVSAQHKSSSPNGYCEKMENSMLPSHVGHSRVSTY